MARWAEFFQASRSGYYSYIKHCEGRKNKKKALSERIKRIFDESGETYGADRICGLLRKTGQKASYRKTSRIMAEMGPNSIHNRHKTRSEGYPNLIRGQTFDKPGMAICSGITYLKSGEGWLYLCAVKDIVGGEILGTSMGANMKRELVVQALLNAQARHNLTPGTIFHSDRGSQYTSKAFMDTLSLYKIKQSFSRIGLPGDNAWVESFFATLKKECIHFNQFATRDELRETEFAWVHSFYNTRRIQAKLGYMPPKEYKELLLREYKEAA